MYRLLNIEYIIIYFSTYIIVFPMSYLIITFKMRLIYYVLFTVYNI